jgi:hypothetical protein
MKQKYVKIYKIYEKFKLFITVIFLPAFMLFNQNAPPMSLLNHCHILKFSHLHRLIHCCPRTISLLIFRIGPADISKFEVLRLGFSTLEDGTDMLSRNVDKELPLLAA